MKAALNSSCSLYPQKTHITFRRNVSSTNSSKTGGWNAANLLLNNQRVRDFPYRMREPLPEGAPAHYDPVHSAFWKDYKPPYEPTKEDIDLAKWKTLRPGGAHENPGWARSLLYNGKSSEQASKEMGGTYIPPNVFEKHM